jgi:hypothetical protein
MIQKLIQKALPEIFKQTFKNLNQGLHKNDFVGFHITAKTSEDNFTNCTLTKIRKDLTKEVIHFNMNEVDFDSLLKNK